MKIIYCKSSGIVGALIRLLTFSKWNHVAIEHNSHVIDSTFRDGVSVSPYNGFFKKYKNVFVEELKDVDQEAAWAFLKSQVGKRYDFMAIVALPFRKSWQNPNRWFCSELVAAAIIKGGRNLKIKSSRVTPRDLWVML